MVSKSRFNLESIFFWLAAFLFFLGMLIQTLSQEFSRELPASPQDSYAYIGMGVLSRECPLQDCPALLDVAAQTTFKTSNESLVSWQGSANDRTMAFMYPLHSFSLATLNTIGFSWETAFFITKILANILLAFGYSLLIRELVGGKSAVLALMFLSIAVFAMRGLHQMAPDHLAIGLGLILWVMILSGKNNSNWKLSILSVCMILLHPLGLVFVSAGIAILVLKSYLEKNLDNQKIKSALLLTSIVIIGYLLPQVINHPQLFQNPPTSQIEEYTPGNRLLLNIRLFLDNIIVWKDGFQSILFQIGMFAFGLYKLKGKQKTNVAAVGLVLCFLVFASLFYVVPRNGFTLSLRLWIPLAVFITAVSSKGMIEVFLVLKKMLLGMRGHVRSNFPKATIALILLVLIALQVNHHFTYYAPLYKYELEHLSSYNDLHYDESQIEIVEKDIDPGERILYQDLTTMLYWFSKGTLKYNAVYEVIVFNTEQQDQWSSNIRYYWSRQPYRNMPNFHHDSLLLEGSAETILDLETAVETIEIYIENPYDPATIVITNKNPTSKEQIYLNIPNGFSGWIEVELHDGPISSFGVRPKNDDSKFIFMGVRIDSDQKTRWPWGKNLLISLVLDGDPSPLKTIHIDKVLRVVDLEFTVIDDNGYSILLEIKEND